MQLQPSIRTCYSRSAFQLSNSNAVTTTSAPGLGSPLPHPHQDWAHRCHICTGTGLAVATSVPGLGSPLPHLHRNWANGHKFAACASRVGNRSCIRVSGVHARVHLCACRRGGRVGQWRACLRRLHSRSGRARSHLERIPRWPCSFPLRAARSHLEQRAALRRCLDGLVPTIRSIRCASRSTRTSEC